MQLSEFDFELPEEYIAQKPAEPRDSCRLLVLERLTGKSSHHVFRELPELLSPGDCVVLNDTRVIPARLYGRLPGGRGQAEILLLRPHPGDGCWEALCRPGKKLSPGSSIEFAGSCVRAVVVSRLAGGKAVVRFEGAGEDGLSGFLSLHGVMPVPPYIHEPLSDPEQYQTVYSRKPGAVAAPTAGLHFTGSLLAAMLGRDILCVRILLHVGYGTFQPVRVERVEDHRMEEEYYEISDSVAREINARRRCGGRIVSVGTSATRALETAFRDDAGVVSGAGTTDLFIYPGFRFRALDCLLTNFHLPRSTPLLLTAAWSGWERISRAYCEAKRLAYRFYSFGDAMLIV